MHKTNAMRLLDAAEIDYEVYTYEVDENDLSGIHAAELLGIPNDLLFKTIVLRSDKNEYLVCLIPVQDEIDLKKIAKASHHKNVELIKMKELLPLTGYVRGGCSPIAMKKIFPTYIDETCLLWDEILISAGQRGVSLRLKPMDLIAFLSAVVVECTK